MKGYRVVLCEKLDVLEKLDDEIIGYLSDEEALEVEIGRANEIRSDIQGLIVRLDFKLKSVETPSKYWGNVAVPRKNTAKLPKRTLNSFGGDPVEF